MIFNLTEFQEANYVTQLRNGHNYVMDNITSWSYNDEKTGIGFGEIMNCQVFLCHYTIGICH